MDEITKKEPETVKKYLNVFPQEHKIQQNLYENKAEHVYNHKLVTPNYAI